jgi:hypothetical protein
MRKFVDWLFGRKTPTFETCQNILIFDQKYRVDSIQTITDQYNAVTQYSLSGLNYLWVYSTEDLAILFYEDSRYSADEIDLEELNNSDGYFFDPDTDCYYSRRFDAKSANYAVCMYADKLDGDTFTYWDYEMADAFLYVIEDHTGNYFIYKGIKVNLKDIIIDSK